MFFEEKHLSESYQSKTLDIILQTNIPKQNIASCAPYCKCATSLVAWLQKRNYCFILLKNAKP
jgi:hypothetical protein